MLEPAARLTDVSKLSSYVMRHFARVRNFVPSLRLLCSMAELDASQIRVTGKVSVTCVILSSPPQAPPKAKT